MELEFVDDLIPQSLESSHDSVHLNRADNMVRCWIINPMIPKLSHGFLYSQSEKELWEKVKEQYGASNEPMAFQL